MLRLLLSSVPYKHARLSPIKFVNPTCVGVMIESAVILLGAPQKSTYKSYIESDLGSRLLLKNFTDLIG